MIVTCLGWLAVAGAAVAAARFQSTSSPESPAQSSQPDAVDGIAVRIESDIITDSEVEELAAYQRLVDGKSQPRSEVIRELIDQWIVRGEATAAQYPQPSDADVKRAYEALRKRFGSPEDFGKRCADAGISEAAVRRILKRQVYLSRFLDFRFRPAAQVDPNEVRDYYDKHLVPQLKAKGEKIPSLDEVTSEIREVLIQQAIDTLSKQWLRDTRTGLTIDILPQGESQ